MIGHSDTKEPRDSLDSSQVGPMEMVREMRQVVHKETTPTK